MCSYYHALRELPPDERRHGGGYGEYQQENRQLLGDRIAGPGNANPHIDPGGGKPDRDKDLGGNDHRLRVVTAYPPPDEQADAEEQEAAEDDDSGAHWLDKSDEIRVTKDGDEVTP